MSDDSPYVSLEDDPSPASAPQVISPGEAQLRQQSGGYLASGAPAPLTALVDTQASGALPADKSPYVSLEDDKSAGPQPLRQMPDFKSESDYRGWVAQHTKDGSMSTPGMNGRSVTVDPFSNGVDVDLRRMYADNATPSPVTGQNELNPTPDMLNKYATPSSPQLTADSMYATGKPASALGTWGTDDDGKPEFHGPNWQPASLTSKILSKAGSVASSVYDAASSVPKAIIQGDDTDAEGLPPIPDYDASGNEPPDVLGAAAEIPKGFAQGTGAAVDALNWIAAQPGGVPWMYDNAKSLLTGNNTTEAEDWLKNGSTYFKSKDDAYAVAKSAGLPGEVAHAVGETGAAINQALLVGPARTIGAAEGSAEAVGQALMDAKEKAIKDSATALQGVVDALGHTAKAAIIPGVTTGIQTGREVYEKTGNVEAAVKAGQAAYLTTVLQFAAPMNAPGGLATRAATGAAINPATTEAGREIMNAALPASMQTDYDSKQSVMAAVQGGVMGATMGGSSPKPDADFGGFRGTAGENAKPFDVNDLEGVQRPPAGYLTQDAKSPALLGFDGRVSETEPQAPPRGKAPETPPPPPSTEFKDLPPEAQKVAVAAQDSGEITVDHGDGGSVVQVAGKPIAVLDTPKAAEAIAEQARSEVDDRRLDLAQRTRVTDMTDEEKNQALLTNPVTDLPNRRAYDESDKKPVQTMIDADSLKWVNDTGGHDAGTQMIQAIGTALHDANPGNVYHLSGDEFVMQGDSHMQVNRAIDEARQRLAGASVDLTGPSGDKQTLNGIGFSHGKGATLDEADQNLRAAKDQRQSEGLRAARGEPPPQQGAAAAGEGVQGEPSQPATAQVLGQKVEAPALPTPAQAEAGNYKKPTVEWNGENIRVENVKGQVRSGSDATGKPWTRTMQHDYGYFAGTKSTDGEGVDVLMGPHPDAPAAHVIDQLDPTGKKFDEHKTVIGAQSPEEAKEIYRANYPEGWKGLGAIQAMPVAKFKDWLHNADHTKPLTWSGGRTADVSTTSIHKPTTLQDITEHPIEPPVAASHADLSPGESKFVTTVGDRTLGAHGQRAISGLVEARNLYTEVTGTQLTPNTLKRVDELVERAVVETARKIVAQGDDPERTFTALVNLYERQPSLNTRTSTSIENQAYSTPAPLAFLASDLGGINLHTSVLEPTAGNGMLLIAADPSMAIVNELNPERAATLKAQGFDVTQKDAASSVLAKEPVDVVIANPPFGVVKENGQSKEFSGVTPRGDQFKTTEIDHAIVLKQLESMKPDGRAVLLIGGVNKLASTEAARSDAYNGSAKRKFFYHLYNNYNVVDHFTVAGQLYSRQGAAWPIDTLVIHGVGKSALPLPAAAPPRVYDSYDALKPLLNKTYESDRLVPASESQTGAAGRDTGAPGSEDGSGRLPVGSVEPRAADDQRLPRPASGGEGVRGEPVQRGALEGRSELPSGGSRNEPDSQQLADIGRAEQLGSVSAAGDSETPTSSELDGTPDFEPGPGRPAGAPEVVGDADGSGAVAAQEPYKPASKLHPLGTLVPGNMRDSIGKSLDNLEREHGAADKFVAKEMGWKLSDLGDKLAAEQVDALALALKQIKAGKGFIIGDQTGIGKGRVVASVIRWAILQGHTPIFLTEKPGLYGDMVRDLRDIGQEDIRPLMTNAGESVPLSDDKNDVLRSKGGAAHNKILQQALNELKLADHNMLFTTYDQMNMKGGTQQLRHQLVGALTPSSILILDESHNAGGVAANTFRKNAEESEAQAKEGRAGLIRGFVSRAKGVFYSSATYAKRPDVMDLYSKTDMAQAVGGNIARLPAAIQAGGVPLQQVVASMLAESGQYIRRERSFNGVKYDTPLVPVKTEAAEAISSMMMKVKEFDDLKGEAVERAKREAKGDAKMVSESGSTGMSGAESANFTSSMHNLIGQMLLALKADAAADEAIASIKRGEKPIVTVSNTMGSFIEQYAKAAGLKAGDKINLGFKDLMVRYLEASRMLTVKDHNGAVISKRRMSDEELGKSAVAAFKRAKDLMDNTPEIQDVPVSPIDWIHKRIRDAGYATGEITGRAHGMEYQKDGSAVYRLRGDKERSTTAKKRELSRFNNGGKGGLDAMIFNRAGSTGLSAHASAKFKDPRPRHMIIAQAEGNIDQHMQMLGRIFRTGQIHLPSYGQLTADIPAETRPAAILAKKMAMLNANTTAARGSAMTAKDSADFMNQYGDEVVAQIMADMPEVHEALGAPLKASDKGDGYVQEDAARKVTGRLPLLKVAVQKEIDNLIRTGYAERLAQADAMGENALEAKALDLDAKPIKKLVLSAATSGDSPFAGASIAEISDVKRLGKPFTSAEVRGQLTEKLGLPADTPLLAAGRMGRDAMSDMVNKTMADYATYRNAEEAKMLASEAKDAAREGRLAALDGTAQRWRQIASTVHVGGQYEFRMAEGASLYGVVTDVSQKKGVKMPTALGSWVVKVALADGSRQTTLPFSKLVTGNEEGGPDKIRVNPATHEPFSKVPIEKMFDDGQTTSRERRVIVTGNLLAGFDRWKSGQIIHFTDHSGGTRAGIMMPRSFNLDEYVETAPVHVAPEKVPQFLKAAGRGLLKTLDGNVSITAFGPQRYMINVAKSKAEGGKYFLDPQLRDIVGDFVSQGSSMRAEVDQGQLVKALKLIESKFEQKFETTTFRPEALAAGGTAIGTQAVAHARDEGPDIQGVRPSPGEIEGTARSIVGKFGVQPSDIVAHKDWEATQKDPVLAGRVAKNAKAFLDPKTMKLHFVASNIQTHSQIPGLIAHEYVGHFGIRSMLGDARAPAYQAILNGLAQGFPLQTAMRGRQEFGKDWDPNKPSHKNIAAEEVLAYYSQRYAAGQSIPARAKRFIDRLFGMLRDFARKVLGLPEKFDEVWLKKVIAGLEAHLRSGAGKAREAQGEPAFGKTEPTFYSGVARAVEGAKREKGTGAEWEATLRNMPGVKAEEMQWLGLKDWLEGRGRVTKQEVAEYVNANQLHLGETLYGMGGTSDTTALMKWMQEHSTEDMGEDPHDVEEREHAEALLDDAARGDPSAIGELEQLGVPEHLLAPFYDTSKSPDHGQISGAPEFADKMEPGGTNYRERLMTLPMRPADKEATIKSLIAKRDQMAEVLREQGRNAVGTDFKYVRDSLNDVEKRLDKVMAGHDPNAYKEGHYGDVPGVVVHIRHDDRTLSTGERAMHIGEIQSDLHQQGRKVGYEKNDPQGVGPGIPDAPFKTTWHELALKRMLRHAVENGYDAMSWDTGQTNADRYGLSERVDSVALRHGSGDFVAYGRDGERLISLSGMGDLGTLAAHIGQPAAEKLLATEPVNGWRKMEGMDLEVGRAKGMKAFYDQMLPQAMNKLLKHFGGKVEQGTLGSGGVKGVTISPRGRTWKVIAMDDHGSYLGGDHASKEAAEAWAKSNGYGDSLPAHIVHITPKMREGVMEGQPLFARDQDLAERPRFARDDDEEEPGKALVPRGPAAYELVRRGVIAVARSNSVMDIRKLLNPKDVDAQSKLTAQLTEPFLADLARQKDMLVQGFQRFSRALDRLSPNDQIDITDFGERGLPQPIAAMQPMADEIRKTLDFWAGQVQDLGTGKLDTLIPDYWARYWQNPDEGLKMFGRIFGKGSMRGPMTFLKKRSIPLFKDGLALGLKPLTVNPLMATVMKVHEMQRYITGVKLLETLKNHGLAVVLRAGRQVPEGWAPINDSIAKIKQWSEEEKGFIDRGQYIMPENAARIINNYLSRSALQNVAIARGLRTFNNLLTSTQLGFSAFHLGFTTFDAMASKAALGFERLAHGEPIRAAQSFFEVLTGPINAGMTMWKGYKLAQAYLNPSGATDFHAQLVKFLMSGGGSPKMDRYFLQAQGVSPFRGVGLISLKDDIKAALSQPRDKVAATAKAIGSFPIEYAQKVWNELATIGRIYHPLEVPFEIAGRLVRASTSWIMEYIVPLQKLGVFSDLGADWLRRNPNASALQYSAGAQSIWRSIDNRLGEMVYRNKFWNATFKNILHLMMRAVGWNDGDVEEIVGAPFDTVKLIDNMIREKRWDPNWITHKMAYVMGMVGVNALMSALIQYLYTGQGPQELKDYVFPKTGRLTKMGTPERLSLPMYVKDIWEFSRQPATTLANKAAPWIGFLHQWMTNTNYWGDRISNPDAAFWKQQYEKGQAMAKEARPFSLQGQKQLVGSSDPGWKGAAQGALPFVGITPAPGYITSPEQIDRREHLDEENSYEKGLRIRANQAKKAGDTVEYQSLRNQIRESMEHRREEQNQIRRDKAKARTPQTSALDAVRPLVEGSGSHAEMAQKIQAAGYPALAGLFASLPATLRPQMRARLMEYA